MEFFNRQRDIDRMKAVLSGDPNLVYFVYGPINSGKTTILSKVFKELPDNYRVFYINFRARDIEDVKDLLKVLFRVREGKNKLQDFLREILRGGSKVLEKIGGIPIPQNIFDFLFTSTEKVEDVLAFLEEYFRDIVEDGYIPILALDEMQTIKEVVNSTGKSVIGKLFNFGIRLTKETHMCHYLCATSDCVFIEDVYSNARLEGRAKYILIDDLTREEAFYVYDKFGFEDKELVWDYIGGKLGDMVSLYEQKKQGYLEQAALCDMLKQEAGRLEWKFDLIEYGEKQGPDINAIKELLNKFIGVEKREYREVKGKVMKFLIEENILFYNPVDATVKVQGRLIHRAIEKILQHE